MPVKFLRRTDGTIGSIPQDVYIQCAISTATQAVDQIVFQADRPYKLVGVTATFSTASSSGTLQLEKCPVGTAAGSGTDMLASTMSLSGTAGVTVGGTLSNTESTLILDTTDRIALDFGGTVTSLANLNITIRLRPLQVPTPGTY